MLRLLSALLLVLAFAGTTLADCRIAYDMGSSGIRVGAAGQPDTAQQDIDFLAPQWVGRSLEEVVVPTIIALRELPQRAGLQRDCTAVGGGFSAWRLAATRNARELAGQLARIQRESGVAVLVIPQAREGHYGYLAARRSLGERLSTSHILDIGGGSLQIAGEGSVFGMALGQKAWLRELCGELHPGSALPCSLQPLTPERLALARALLDRQLAKQPGSLPPSITLTAISRPVTRGVAPAVEKLLRIRLTEAGLAAADLSRAVALLAVLTPEEAATRLATPPKYLAYLLSDMILVDGLLRSTGVNTLKIAEAELTNVPGLLADEHAYAWAAQYGCYLQQLERHGIAAFTRAPSRCPPPKR